MMNIGVQVFIQINIFEYSPRFSANYLVPFNLCVEQKVCIHVYIYMKCSLSERFIFQNSLNKGNINKA
jgi:hypothetical protein